MNKVIVPSSVTVVAVTKTLPAQVIIEAYHAGIRHFGENRVPEFAKKYEELPSEIQRNATWHMVGHVQGRKASDVARLFDWVDSVDSIELARKLSTHAKANNKTLHILLQVNIAGESGKTGFDLQHFHLSINESVKLPNIIVEGVMVMPPFVVDPEDNRLVFRQAKKLCDEMGLTQLSMGTSQDYEVAISEGATMVRLGEALFGKRKP
jgi:PLP dependent protein